jgi:hypothetical protein
MAHGHDDECFDQWAKMAIGLISYVRRLLRMTRFHERAKLDARLAHAGLAVVAARKVPGLGGQVSVVAIGHRAGS